MFKLTFFASQNPGTSQWGVDKVLVRGRKFTYLDDPTIEYNLTNRDGFFETEADAWREALVSTEEIMMAGIEEIKAKIALAGGVDDI